MRQLLIVMGLWGCTGEDDEVPSGEGDADTDVDADSDADADALIELLAGVPSKVNLIPFNPWPGSKYECSPWPRIEAFAARLKAAGFPSPIRQPRGRDILAACGQLRSISLKRRGQLVT